MSDCGARLAAGVPVTRAPAGTPVRLRLTGPLRDDQVRWWSTTLQQVLARRGVTVVDCDVAALHPTDVGAVGRLARLQLVARRAGGSLRLRRAPATLRGLLGLAGLAAVLPPAGSAVGGGGQPEQGEQPGGVEEAHQRHDPAV